MGAVLNAIFPVLALVALGWALRRSMLPSAEFWSGLSRLGYRVLFPALLFSVLVRADFASVRLEAVVSLLAMLFVALLATLACAWPFLKARGVARAEYSSLFQATIRWNAFIALAIVENLLGTGALAVVSLAMLVWVVPSNVAAVIVAERFGSRGAEGALWAGLLTNPIILACLLALAWRLVGIPLPAVVTTTLDLLGRAALGTGILMVGASLDLRSLRAPRLALVVPVLARAVVLPLLFGAGALALSLAGPVVLSLIVMGGVPTAMAGYVLARETGGDAELYATIVTAQTLASFVTLPAMLVAFQ